MGRDFSQCLLKQEDGFTVPSITDNSMSSERKHKEKAYCQVLSTPASTKRVLPFSSSKLPSSSRGRPTLHDSVEATQLYYREVARENDAAKLRLQEELIAAQEELARVREKCTQLERENTRLENYKRRSNEAKQNDTKIYRSSDPFVASEIFLRELSSNNNENADVVAGVVRALGRKNSKSICYQQWKQTYQICACSWKASSTSSFARNSSRGYA